MAPFPTHLERHLTLTLCQSTGALGMRFEPVRPAFREGHTETGWIQAAEPTRVNEQRDGALSKSEILQPTNVVTVNMGTRLLAVRATVIGRLILHPQDQVLAVLNGVQ
ncbi:hypothetical protein DEMA109039_12275 [Deinococcus marmoris]|nr:hypothetical protein [Deinococcus marmoris]